MASATKSRSSAIPPQVSRPQKLLYSRVEAAEMLSLSVSTLDVAMGRGMLRFRRAGRRVLIEKRELERFSREEHAPIWAGRGAYRADPRFGRKR
jgi:excisionase family DNA binding protein